MGLDLAKFIGIAVKVLGAPCFPITDADTLHSALSEEVVIRP
jgi:hypothetical protein